MNYPKGTIIHKFGVGSMMAQTTHTQVVSTGEQTSDGKLIVKENKKGARKRYVMRTDAIDNGTLLFIGDVPFKTDGETKLPPDASSFSRTLMRGNACLNLTGDPAVIKEWIETKNLNPAFTRFDTVIHIDGETETPLYPEAETSHAVVLRMRAKINAPETEQE